MSGTSEASEASASGPRPLETSVFTAPEPPGARNGRSGLPGCCWSARKGRSGLLRRRQCAQNGRSTLSRACAGAAGALESAVLACFGVASALKMAAQACPTAANALQSAQNGRSSLPRCRQCCRKGWSGLLQYCPCRSKRSGLLWCRQCARIFFELASVPSVHSNRLFEPAVRDHSSNVLVSVTLCPELLHSFLRAWYVSSGRHFASNRPARTSPRGFESCDRGACSHLQVSIRAILVLLSAAQLLSVHGHARVHTSIYIYT